MKGNTMKEIQLSFFIFLLFCTSDLRAQQEYSGESVFDCNNQSSTPPSPSYLYTCNGQSRSCKSFLIFTAQPNYGSVSAISALLSSAPLELARINNVSDSFTFPTNKSVIVPVNCSCSGQYYQANTSYAVVVNDTYDALASSVYQGLSSCSAIMGENSYDPNNLAIGVKLLVPLRCACPTRKQAMDGVKYLLTYSISEGESLPDLSDRFNVSNQATAFANGFSELDPIVYFTTTILIPLPREPLSSQAIIRYPIPPSPSLPPSRNPDSERSKKKLNVGIAIGSAVLLVLCIAIPIAIWLHKRRMKPILEKKKCILQKDVLDAIAGEDHGLKLFVFEELKEATENFSSVCRIKGSVYRGVVRGAVSAIKLMSREVTKEVNILHKLNHFNLISLRGMSVGEENCYLVYEYMENGSLKDWLHDSSRSGLWSLMQRVLIALDVANGLNYLHNFTEPPYVHENINSSNVLLNGNLRAKITNFSFARSSERRVTEKVKGTLGYMPPEYLNSGIVTTKLDVFAFGVVLSELITGKDVIMECEGEKMLSAAMIAIVEGTDAEAELIDFMDAAMRGRWQMDLALAMAKLSARCLGPDPESRPSMDEVVSVLLRIQRDPKYWERAYI